MRAKKVFWSAQARAGILVALLAGAVAAPANAGVTATILQNQVTNTLTGNTGVPAPSGAVGPVIDQSVGAVDSFYGLTVTGLSLIDPASNTITFKNGVIGEWVDVSFTTGVALTFHNDQRFAYRPVIESTLLAAGFGVSGAATYAGNNGPQTDTSRCEAVQLKNCGVVDHAAWKNSGFGDAGPATAGFDFNVSVGNTSIYDLNASISGSVGPTGSFTTTFNGVDKALSNFHSTLNNSFGQAYAWDDTHVVIQLPDLLQPGQSVTANFTVTNFASSASFNQNDGFAPNYTSIAYSSFGDPTGARRGINPHVVANGLGGPAGPPGVDLNSFGSFTLPTEVVDPVTHSVTDAFMGQTTQVNKSPHPYAPVPEPAARALFGLGALGLIARRRG